MSTSTMRADEPLDASWRRPPATTRQRRSDIILAAAILVGALLALTLYQIGGVFEKPAPMWVSLIWAVAITAPLAVRRRWPSIVAIVVAAVFAFGGIVLVPEMLFSNIALFIALYTVGAWVDNRRIALVVRAVISAAMIGWLIVALFQQATDPKLLEDYAGFGAQSPFVAFMLIQILTNLLYFGGAYYFGDHAYAASRQHALLEQRTKELELERERTAAQAVELERVRIARELHDVVAHHVSVMGVQAGAARTVLSTNPDAARDALANVELNARSAIDELHKLVTTLREPGAETLDAPSAGASTLSLAQLTTLVNDSTAAGLPTTFDIVGPQRTVPQLVATNLYRITQESLTNARKYAGANATADVRVRFLADAVELEVANTGAVPAQPRPGGLGQVGMRERVAAMGGEIEIGRRSRGGYLVRARVPLEPATTDAAGNGSPEASPASSTPSASPQTNTDHPTSSPNIGAHR